jgi:hypothetical protein
VAIAEELHGRLNYDQLGTKSEINRLRKYADADFFGGYEAVKAYLRAKWETTQWLLDNANMHTLHLYRGLKNMENKRGKSVPVSSKPIDFGGGYTSSTEYNSLPEMTLERNGAASTSANPRVPEQFGSTIMRLKVPRTAVVSVPVYGQNLYGEQETVVAGTAYKAWDAWANTAPNFKQVPL